MCTQRTGLLSCGQRGVMTKWTVHNTTYFALQGVVPADFTLDDLLHVEYGTPRDDTAVELLATFSAIHAPDECHPCFVLETDHSFASTLHRGQFNLRFACGSCGGYLHRS